MPRRVTRLLERAPAPERFEQLSFDRRGHRLVGKPSDHRASRPKLRHVRAAAVATRDVLLEAGALEDRKRALEVIGHELHHLPAGHRRYSSSFCRTVARARCSLTRSFAAEMPSSELTSPASNPATSRSKITSRCFGGRVSMADLTCWSVSSPRTFDSGRLSQLCGPFRHMPSDPKRERSTVGRRLSESSPARSASSSESKGASPTGGQG